MKLKSILLIVGTILGVTHSANSQNQLVTYPAPEGAELMSDFTVQVREAGKDLETCRYLHGQGQMKCRIPSIMSKKPP